jgi:hypothetical protein
MICINGAEDNTRRHKADLTIWCLMIAAGCFLSVGIGCTLNLITPGIISLEYLMIAGVFYLILSGVNCIQTLWCKKCHSQANQSSNRFDQNITEINDESRFEKTGSK